MLRNMLVILIIVLLVYISLSALLYFYQNKLLYIQKQQTFVIHEQAVEIQSNGHTLRGWVLNPAAEHAVIYLGGNAEQVEENIPLYKQSLEATHAVYLVNYRGYGQSDGTPDEAALYADALTLYDNIKSKYKSISVIGRSLGSGVATYLAARRPVDKLALITPYDSIENVARSKYWMFPVKWLLQDKFYSWRNVSDIQAETLILIASEDYIVPHARTEALIKHFEDKAKTVEQITIPGSDHINIVELPESIKKIRTFFNSPMEPVL